MTELSDYQRIIEKPRLERMQGQINALAADRDRLRGTLQRMVDDWMLITSGCPTPDYNGSPEFLVERARAALALEQSVGEKT